jgi:hypothetical protein
MAWQCLGEGIKEADKPTLTQQSMPPGAPKLKRNKTMIFVRLSHPRG